MNKYILTILFFISTSIAQSLTVDECVRIALENKPSLKRAEQDVAIARLNRASTGALMLPSVNASNSFSETTYGNTSSEASERYSGGLSLSQSLFNFGTKINTLKQSDNTYNTAKQQRRQAKARIILDVHTFYYQYLKNSELFDIAGKDLELSKKQLDLVQNQYNLGAVSKTDFLKASVRYGTAKSSFLSRELSKKNSEKSLRFSMGLLNSDIPIIIKQKMDLILSVPTFDEAYSLMLSNSPDLSILDNQISGAQINVKKAWSSSLPSINMSIGMNASSADQITRTYFDDNYIKSANITVSIPIFSGFRNRNSIQISKLQLDQAETRLSGGKNSAKVSLYALINTLNNYQEIIPIQEEVLLSAEEDLKLAQQRYELGSASILVLLDAQLALIQASSSLVRTKYDAAIQVANLDDLLGTLDKKYE
ncbi:TolC family protein [Candidatus Marinimicrobia bacterium]|nr:TolC family protein [Candidatus Neomarinimicrobiota bacterium]MDC1000803.1 TolC family protein [Candidatus Neomarinimicrobiota bacterium]|tara:strand:+ start:5504 stop:6775 length:1272 start_codon:yes stop_codon:yes gene_type:complete